MSSPHFKKKPLFRAATLFALFTTTSWLLRREQRQTSLFKPISHNVKHDFGEERMRTFHGHGKDAHRMSHKNGNEWFETAKNNTSDVDLNDFNWFPYPLTTPPAHSLFWMLWNQNVDIAQRAFSSKFIQGVQSATLPISLYISWTRSDAFYCAQSARFYKMASKRAFAENNFQLAHFLAKKYHWYLSYNLFFESPFVNMHENRTRHHYGHHNGVAWNENVVPSRVILEYVSFQHWVVQTFPPIYTLIVTLPCEWIWPWLTIKLADQVNQTNPYFFWFLYNQDTSAAFATGNFLWHYLHTHPSVTINFDVANDLYRTATTFEIDNFNDLQI